MKKLISQGSTPKSNGNVKNAVDFFNSNLQQMVSSPTSKDAPTMKNTTKSIR